MLNVMIRLALAVLPACLLGTGLLLMSRPLNTSATGDVIGLRLGLTACALPCWAGIVPGETPFEQAPQTIADHLAITQNRFTVSSSHINYWLTITDEPFSGLIDYERGVVSDIRINAPVPMWYLMALLGPPDCVWIDALSSQEDIIGVYWERDGLSTGAILNFDKGAAWQPDTLMDSVWASTQVGFCDEVGALRWRGFAPFWRYWEQNSAAIIH
ncbi:MAG: hypothetical protein H7175_03800 [Burkholderiales bacterium]|nr:hypothetical protein [Anaerolineae bacterium]